MILKVTVMYLRVSVSAPVAIPFRNIFLKNETIKRGFKLNEAKLIFVIVFACS